MELFSGAAARAVGHAAAYLEAVGDLMKRWRDQLSAGAAPRADAGAWAVLDVRPAHPMIKAPVAAAGTDRAKAAIHHALKQLVECGVPVVPSS